MSRRRGPPRGAKVEKQTYFSDSDDLSAEELNLLEVFQAILQENSRNKRNQRSTRKRRTPKRPRQRLSLGVSNSAKSARQTQKKPKLTESSENLDLLSFDSDEEKVEPVITETVTTDHLKKVENKVNNFFKSSNLLSDDEDEEEIIPKTSNKVIPPVTKDFYELSDSDEEFNRILKKTVPQKTTVTSTLPGPSGSKDIQETKNDELMDIVDKILVCDDNTLDLTNNEPDESWSSYKNKAQDMLGSINNLLNEIDKETKPPEEPKPSPEKTKPTCPICLEQLGGDVIMMTTICGHIFCKDCITKVAKTSKSCPTCRKQVNLKKIHAVYL